MTNLGLFKECELACFEAVGGIPMPYRELADMTSDLFGFSMALEWALEEET